MKTFLRNIWLVFSIINVNVLFANVGDTGWRNITSFGCHLVDGTCYFNIDGSAVGPSNCLSNNLRFNVLDSPNGKIWFSLLQIAYTANKQVRFNISNCYNNQPQYPTFKWGQINKQ